MSTLQFVQQLLAQLGVGLGIGEGWEALHGCAKFGRHAVFARMRGCATRTEIGNFSTRAWLPFILPVQGDLPAML